MGRVLSNTTCLPCINGGTSSRVFSKDTAGKQCVDCYIIRHFIQLLLVHLLTENAYDFGFNTVSNIQTSITSTLAKQRMIKKLIFQEPMCSVFLSTCV